LKLCTSCQARFPEGFGRCLHCGRRLVAEEDAAPAPAPAPGAPGEGDADADWLAFAVREPVFAAELAQALHEGGIRFRLAGEGETDPGHAGRAGWETRLEIQVHREDREEAERIASRHLRQSLPDLPPDFDPEADPGEGCPACGADVRSGAAACTDCGLAFPDA